MWIVDQKWNHVKLGFNIAQNHILGPHVIIYIDLNGTVPQKNFDISVFSIYKVRYIRIYLTWK